MVSFCISLFCKELIFAFFDNAQSKEQFVFSWMSYFFRFVTYGLGHTAGDVLVSSNLLS
jgi:hypothetical protein